MCHPGAGYWMDLHNKSPSVSVDSRGGSLTSLNLLHCFITRFILCRKVCRLRSLFSQKKKKKTAKLMAAPFFLPANAAMETFPMTSESPVSRPTCKRGLFVHRPALCSHPHLDYIQSCDSSPQRAAC